MSTIGVKIDEIYALREQKRALEEQINLLASQIEDRSNELMDLMDAQGVTKSTGNTATVYVSESIKPAVENWDDFYKYIHRHKYYHLLERRPSVTGCRELLETKGKIPGIMPFKQRKLNVRTIS